MPNIEYISKKARSLCVRYGTRDPFSLCDALDIGVKYKDLGDKIKGYFFYQSRIKTIVLNSRTDNTVNRILCAHELGHAVLHSDMLCAMKSLHDPHLFDTASLTEYEANVFASELLIDDAELSELLRCNEYSLFQIASILYVPIELLDFKLRILNNKGYNIDVPYLAQSDFLKQISI